MKSIALIFFLTASAALAALQPVELLTDYRVNPLGIDTAPRLFWRADADGRQGAAQTSYQIQAAAQADGFDGELLWDSGKVESAESTRIAYGGPKPASRQRVWWRVKLWDESGAAGDWSQPAWFETGLLDPADWRDAPWIGCGRRHDAPSHVPAEEVGPWIKGPDGAEVRDFTYEFDLPNKPVVSAILWWGNNPRVEMELNDISMVRTRRTASANFVDLAFHLKPGERNVIRLAPKKPIRNLAITAGLHIVYGDGTEQRMVSGTDWKLTVAGRPRRPLAATIAGPYGKPPHGKALHQPKTDLPPVWLRTGVKVGESLSRARLYLCALGSGIPHINGERLDDAFFSPPQSDYEDFSYYTTHDITTRLKAGENSLAVLLDPGWFHQVGGFGSLFSYGHPGLRAVVALDYADGRTEWVTSNADWQWKQSGFLSANIYTGEKIDYRFDHEEWKNANGGAGWQPVRAMEPLSPRLRAMEVEPVRPKQQLKPVKTWQTGDKTWMVDFGEVLHGVVNLAFDEPAGTIIRIRYYEHAEPGKMGNVPGSHWWCHGAPQNDILISDGRKRTFQQQFSTKSFRYAEITGLSREPAPGDFTAWRVHSDVKTLFDFESSDQLLNRLFANGIRTHENYLNHMFGDLPRERCLWGAESIYSWGSAFNGADAAANHRLMARLWLTGRMTPDGVPGNIGVGQRLSTVTNSFIWTVTPLFIASKLHEQYGDLDLAGEFYDKMQHVLDWAARTSKDGTFPQYALSDHAPPSGVPRTPVQGDLINAMAFFDAQRYFARMAESLDKAQDAAEARAYADVIRKGILTRYDAEKHTFGNGTQDSLALAYGIFTDDPAEEKALAESMVGYYRTNGHKFDGGFMTYELYPMLTEHGYVDDALTMLLNSDYPGPAGSVVHYDATTYWERYLLDKKEQLDRGLNFVAFAHPTDWMVRYLAGIRLDPSVPGGRRLILEPHVPSKRLDHVKASQETQHGTIRS